MPVEDERAVAMDDEVADVEDGALATCLSNQFNVRGVDCFRIPLTRSPELSGKIALRGVRRKAFRIRLC